MKLFGAPRDFRNQGLGDDPKGAPIVLLVAADDALREDVVLALVDRFCVRSARDDRDLAERCGDAAPDVVLVDAASGMRPAALFQDAKLRGVPAIWLVDDAGSTQLASLFAQGVSECLRKPLVTDELCARVAAQARMRRLEAQLARSERLVTLGAMTGAVAHQIRNPLAALVSGLPAMQERLGPTLDASSSEMLTLMHECAQRLDEMSRDLLELSRIERAGEALFSPGKGLGAALRVLGARGAGMVEITSEIDTAPMLRGMPGTLNHAYVILLDNALRAMPEGGLLHVRAQAEDGFYVVRVEDSGQGVAAGERERIFEPLISLWPGRRELGLGLSLARAIAAEHGGTLSCAESTLGGAAFELRLPLSQ